MGGGDPQDLVNEELLANSDIQVAIFKGRLGGTRGTKREVRYFMENGKARRVMLFVNRDDTLRDGALRSFIDEMKGAAYVRLGSLLYSQARHCFAAGDLTLASPRLR
jgi:hypothetical protein